MEEETNRRGYMDTEVVVGEMEEGTNRRGYMDTEVVVGEMEGKKRDRLDTKDR